MSGRYRRGHTRLVDDELRYVVTRYSDALRRLGSVTRYLSLEQQLRIADAAVEGDVVIRDVGLLESALSRPQTTPFGEDAYPDLHTKPPRCNARSPATTP